MNQTVTEPTDGSGTYLGHASENFNGEGKSLAIWTRGWKGQPDDQPVHATRVIPAGLSNWEAYLPPTGTVAVDPVLGRIVFPPKQFPRNGVYGSSQKTRNIAMDVIV